MKKDLHKITFLWLLIIFLPSIPVFSQEVPHPTGNRGIYEFLDELAGDHIISIISAIKPYSRSFIADCLTEADKKRDLLSYRQQKELDFFLRDFGKEIPSDSMWFNSSFLNIPESKKSGDEDIFSRWIKGIKPDKRWDFFYYADSLFSITVNPVFGGELFVNSSGKIGRASCRERV